MTGLFIPARPARIDYIIHFNHHAQRACTIAIVFSTLCSIYIYFCIYSLYQSVHQAVCSFVAMLNRLCQSLSSLCVVQFLCGGACRNVDMVPYRQVMGARQVFSTRTPFFTTSPKTYISIQIYLYTRRQSFLYQFLYIYKDFNLQIEKDIISKSIHLFQPSLVASRGVAQL